MADTWEQVPLGGPAYPVCCAASCGHLRTGTNHTRGQIDPGRCRQTSAKTLNLRLSPSPRPNVLLCPAQHPASPTPPAPVPAGPIPGDFLLCLKYLSVCLVLAPLLSPGVPEPGVSVTLYLSSVSSYLSPAASLHLCPSLLLVSLSLPPALRPPPASAYFLSACAPSLLPSRARLISAPL